MPKPLRTTQRKRAAKRTTHVSLCTAINSGDGAQTVPANVGALPLMIIADKQNQTGTLHAKTAHSNLRAAYNPSFHAHVNEKCMVMLCYVQALPISLLVRLPDAVLLQILRCIDDASVRMAVYQSCKDIRDCCNHNMKSVTVQICSGRTMQETEEHSSKTVCPKAAFDIEKITLRYSKASFMHAPSTHRHTSQQTVRDPLSWVSNAYAYLEQLFDSSGQVTDEEGRKKVDNISAVDLYLPDNTWEPEVHRQILARLLSRFPNLQTLASNNCLPLSNIVAPRLQHLFLRSPIAPELLRQLASKHPKLQRLELVVEHGAQLSLYKPALLQVTALRHLTIKARGRASVPASLLADLKQLSNLELHYINLPDPQSLTQLPITHLTLISVTTRSAETCVNAIDEPQQAANWPALKSVEFAAGLDVAFPISEALARSILPLPHPGFNVSWPTSVSYSVDELPDPKLGYVGVAHMRTVNELHLSGRHAQSALSALVKSKVAISKLFVSSGVHTLDSKDVAACLSFPSVVEMQLNTPITNMPETFRQIFLQCPGLKTLLVPRASVPQEMKLEQCLHPLGVERRWSGACLQMVRCESSIMDRFSFCVGLK